MSQTGTSNERNYVTQSGGGDFSATITQTTSAYTGGPQYDTNTINQYSYIDSASISQQRRRLEQRDDPWGTPSQSAIGNNATVAHGHGRQHRRHRADRQQRHRERPDGLGRRERDVDHANGRHDASVTQFAEGRRPG